MKIGLNASKCEKGGLMNILKLCIEFVLMLLMLWLAAMLVIFAGTALLVFTPIIVLLFYLYETDIDEDDY